MKLTSDTIQKFGSSTAIHCPQCGKMVSLDVLRASNGVGLFGISLFNYNYDLFGFCPECFALYAIKDEVTKTEAHQGHNHPTQITEEDLIYLQTLPVAEHR